MPEAHPTYTAHLTKNFTYLLIGVLIFSLGSAFIPLILVSPDDPDKGAAYWISGIITLLVLLVTIPTFFLHTRLTLSDSGVDISMLGIFTKHLPYTSISTLEEGPTTVMKHGAGLRIIALAHTGYLSGGPSVTFTLTDGQKITASTPEPAQVIQAFNARLATI